MSKSDEVLAVATNWNGDELTITVSPKGASMETLVRRAFDKFHGEKHWTIRLDLIDGEEVPDHLKYR